VDPLSLLFLQIEAKKTEMKPVASHFMTHASSLCLMCRVIEEHVQIAES
jgi:hypothetical protein